MAKHGTRREPGRAVVTTVSRLCAAMESIAPLHAAADWDNVGLLIGDASWPVRRLLLTIDLMPSVLDEAVVGRCDAIVAYHPPIFRGVKSLRPERASQEGVAAAALSERIAVYSPHTALDAAPGGTNDTLAALAGISGAAPFTPARDPLQRCKLVTFVPENDLERVAAALFEAGAGRIGDYSHCSFRLQGQGTFLGGPETNPAIGRRGCLERVAETRLEVLFDRRTTSVVIDALRRSHPYEEPAFDIYSLDAAPLASLGQGRMGEFARPTSVAALARSLARQIGVNGVSIVGSPGARVRRGFVCVGAAGSLPFEIPGVSLGEGDVVITGEIRHHDALQYARSGTAAIALGHWASERPVLQPLASRLRGLLKGLSIIVSRRDLDPFRILTS
ncbi:MAG: Nif3-like dinuclear metal center hexameric protein [Phycisphaerae bacterium]|nr:Nif3-like dinuclear metal center hexameric protein [Phycisphaerae bacterium]